MAKGPSEAYGQKGGLCGRQLVVGVAGGIAVYKVAGVVSRLRQDGADVHVIMTQNATQFVTPLTFRALSGNPVHVDSFSPGEEFTHLRLADSADAFLVAPATANIIAKMACGMADDLLSTTILAAGTRVPVIVAPAMNTHMWENPIVRRNIRLLQEAGYMFVGPEFGFLAEGSQGVGRLAAEESIIAAVKRALGIH